MNKKIRRKKLLMYQDGSTVVVAGNIRVSRNGSEPVEEADVTNKSDNEIAEIKKNLHKKINFIH